MTLFSKRNPLRNAEIINEPLYGTRGFDIWRLGRGVELRGKYSTSGKGQLFPSSGTARAKCLFQINDQKYLTDDELSKRLENIASSHLRDGTCSCGIYALYGNNVVAQGYTSLIYATVIGWGEVIRGNQGWRAEYAKIDTLWIDFRCKASSAGYQKCVYPGLPVVACYNGKNSVFQSFLCDYHVDIMLESSARYKGRLSCVKAEELFEEISMAYPLIPMRFGVPWEYEK